MIRIFVVDDHEVVRRGLRAAMTGPEFDVVGEAADAAHATTAIRRCGPDVAIIDHHLPDGDGMTLCRHVTASVPRARCVVLTSTPNDRDMIAAFDAGAVAYIGKDDPLRELVATIREVAEGHAPLDEARVRLARRRLRDTDVGHVDSLTPQEHEIFRHIRLGLTNREIADEMAISDKTVKNYVSNVLAKLGVNRRAEAAAIAGRLEAHAFSDAV